MAGFLNQALFPHCRSPCRFWGMTRTNAQRPPAGSPVRESVSVSVRRSSITATAQTVTSNMMSMRQNSTYRLSWATCGSALCTAAPLHPLLPILFLTNYCWKMEGSLSATAFHQRQTLFHLVCLLTHLPWSPIKQSYANQPPQRFDTKPPLSRRNLKSWIIICLLTSSAPSTPIELWIILTTIGMFGKKTGKEG